MSNLKHLGGNVPNGDPKTFYPKLWNKIIKDNNIHSICDVGCGEGHMIEYCKYKLNVDGIGIDGLPLNIDKCKSKNIHCILHDYTTGPLILETEYDLGWSCEFVEHVAEQYKNNFLQTFNLCKYLCITHALPNQKGYHHVNCQPSEYWISCIESIGYILDMNYSLELRKEANSYFSKTGLFFRKVQ